MLFELQRGDGRGAQAARKVVRATKRGRSRRKLHFAKVRKAVQKVVLATKRARAHSVEVRNGSSLEVLVGNSSARGEGWRANQRTNGPLCVLHFCHYCVCIYLLYVQPIYCAMQHPQQFKNVRISSCGLGTNRIDQ
jgi:hypothetical protein